MAFEFLREELTEARYIRRPNEVTGASGFDLSEDFYEHLLALQQMRYENPAWAQKYAKDTLRYMNFSQVRTGATDLHNLAAILSNPSKFNDKVTDLDNISFDEFKFKRYLRDIIGGKEHRAQDRQMFLAMQKNLGIRNSFLRNARRVIGDYNLSTDSERKQVSSRLVNVFRRDGQFRSDMFKSYATTVSNKGLLIEPEQQQAIQGGGKIPGWVKGAAVIAGAYALGRKYF